MTRKHAEIFAVEDEYIRVFDMVTFPVHHYYGTYLAIKGLSLETTCSTGFNFQKWAGINPHPEVFQKSYQIVPDLFQVGTLLYLFHFVLY